MHHRPFDVTRQVWYYHRMASLQQQWQERQTRKRRQQLLLFLQQQPAPKESWFIALNSKLYQGDADQKIRSCETDLAALQTTGDITGMQRSSNPPTIVYWLAARTPVAAARTP